MANDEEFRKVPERGELEPLIYNWFCDPHYAGTEYLEDMISACIEFITNIVTQIVYGSVSVWELSVFCDGFCAGYKAARKVAV